MVPEKTLRAVLEKAAALNGGTSLGENAAPLAEMVIQKALAFCQRQDVPEDMEPAAAALLLALWRGLPRSGGDEGGAGDTQAMSWEALAASGAVKSIQRGDTAITFHSGGTETGSGAVSGTVLTAEGALEDLKPWRRLGRLKGGV